MQVAERFLGHLLATRQYVKAAALTPDLLKVVYCSNLLLFVSPYSKQAPAS